MVDRGVVRGLKTMIGTSAEKREGSVDRPGTGDLEVVGVHFVSEM